MFASSLISILGGWVVTSAIAEGVIGRIVNIAKPLPMFLGRLVSAAVGSWLFQWVTPKEHRKRLVAWFFAGGAANTVVFTASALAAQRRIPYLPGLVEPLTLPAPGAVPAQVEAAAQKPIVEPTPQPPQVKGLALAAMASGGNPVRYAVRY